MTTAGVSAPVDAAGAVQFLGKESAYWRLRIKGAALVMLTLGLYRFWLATDVRRYLWSNTEIAGDTLEYDGLATELLVGFLYAIAILVPLYTVIAVVTLANTVSLPSVAFGLLFLALVGQYSLYRARRYRLTRTVFRGLRFDQHGSPWSYALRALAWWSLAVLSIGIAYPWVQSNLQRFKMRHTSYGDLAGRFEGSGSLLFLRGLWMWFLVIGPIVVAVGTLSAVTDWDALGDALAHDDDTLGVLAGALLFGPAHRVVLTCLGLSAGIALALYPLFQAMTMRWWVSGLRFDGVSATSHLRTAQVYVLYLRFALFIVLFATVAAVAGTLCIFIIAALLRPGLDSDASEIAATALTVCLYIGTALGISVIYQVAVSYAMWRLTARSVELSGTERLANVRAEGAPSSALGEGLADALGVGGL